MCSRTMRRLSVLELKMFEEERIDSETFLHDIQNTRNKLKVQALKPLNKTRTVTG